MNQLPELLLVGTECIDGIEAGQPQAAERAAALLIQRKSIQERSFTVDAVILGFKCSRLEQTSAANGDAGNLTEGLAAEAAIIGEKAAKGPFCERQNRTAEIGQQGT